MRSYALWNNKGGVGKTFLSFVLATEYAKEHPEQLVVVIDMCPQADVSEILLGGSIEGAKNVDRFISDGKTIGGYFDKRFYSPHRKTGGETGYLINVCRHNELIPPNLSLIAGDRSLENQVKTINNLVQQDDPPDSWKNIHSWVLDLEESILLDHSGRDVLFIVDCNPSLSAYTEQGLLAAGRLIVPCSPDGGSARAIDNISELVYGYNVPDKHKNANFSVKMEKHAMKAPLIHMVVLNRTTQYSKRPAVAFQSMLDQVKNKIEVLRDSDKSHRIFGGNGNLYTYMPDAHTICVVCSTKGIPLHKIEPIQYPLPNGRCTKVNDPPLTKYKQEVKKIIEKL